MPKLLITEATLVNYGDDRGGVHEDAGALINPGKDTADALVRIGRALYVEKKDDPDKSGRNTASADMLAAAEALAKAAARKTAKDAG